MYKFTKNVTASLVFSALASACLADVAAVLDSPKEKTSAQQEQQTKSIDVPEKPEKITEKKTDDQSQKVTNEFNNEVITEHVDPKTGEKYQELKAEFNVKYFGEYKQDSNTVIIKINNYAVRMLSIDGSNSLGYISTPFHANREEFYKYIGFNARLFCRMKDIEDLRKSCRLCPRNAGFEKYCTLYGKKEYFLVIE